MPYYLLMLANQKQPLAALCVLLKTSNFSISFDEAISNIMVLAFFRVESSSQLKFLVLCDKKINVFTGHVIYRT